MTTSNSSTYQEYDSKKWRAELSLNVKVRKIDDAGKLLTAANEAGADGVGGPSFSVDDTRAAYASALRQAIEDARAKAEAAAAQMGVKVGGVVSVDDQAGGVLAADVRGRRRGKASGDSGGADAGADLARHAGDRRDRDGRLHLHRLSTSARAGRRVPARAGGRTIHAMPRVVTLLSDFGLRDEYAGVMEAVIAQASRPTRGSCT